MSSDAKDMPDESPLNDAALAATAAGWMARRDAGLNAEEQAELRAWLRNDSRHAKALAAVDADATALNWPLHTGAVDRIVAGLEARAQRRKQRRRTATAACCAALVLLGAGLFLRGRFDLPAKGTIVVQVPRQQILPDGSKVELNDGAEVSVAFSATERRIELLRGTAHFDVHKDPSRPFLVSTGNLTVRAVGTAFAVGIEAQQVALLVTEGLVAVDHRQPASAPAPVTNHSSPSASAATFAMVQAGESVAVKREMETSAAPVVTPLPPSEWSERLAWRIPRLEFASTPLSEVVETVNRYNRRQLVLADAALAKLRLSGALRADRIDGLLELLEADFQIIAERNDGRIILHQRR